jgi:hypothetical protein
MLLFSVGISAMNAPRYWQQRDDGWSTVETSANIPSFSYLYAMMNFKTALAIKILIANSCTRWRFIFKSLSTG